MSDIVDRLAAAINAHDLEAAARLMHPDYRSAQPAHPARAFVGREQMHANWQAMFAGVPDLRAELIRSVDDGNMTWCEWAWTGNRTDGAPFHVRGVTLFEVTGDLITGGRLYMETVEEEGGGIEADVEEMSGRRPIKPKE